MIRDNFLETGKPKLLLVRPLAWFHIPSLLKSLAIGTVGETPIYRARLEDDQQFVPFTHEGHAPQQETRAPFIRPPRRWWPAGPRYTMAFHSCTQHSKSPTLALIDDNIQITVYDESLTGIIGFPDCLIMTSYHMIGTGLLYE